MQTAFINYYTGFFLLDTPKLLAITKNSLRSNGRPNPYRFKYKNRCRGITTTFRKNLEVSQISLRKKRYRIQQKKAELEVINNKTYNLLNENVFKPFRKKIIESKDFGFLIPCLEFDPLNVYESDYIDEGIKHLKQDLNDDFKDFESLGSEIIDYNKDLKNFEKNRLYTLISWYFELRGYKVIHKPEIPITENTIGITELIPKLKQFWSEDGFSFDYRCKDGYLKINNHRTIAKVCECREKDIMDCIENVKNIK